MQHIRRHRSTDRDAEGSDDSSELSYLRRGGAQPVLEEEAWRVSAEWEQRGKQQEQQQQQIVPVQRYGAPALSPFSRSSPRQTRLVTAVAAAVASGTGPGSLSPSTLTALTLKEEKTPTANHFSHADVLPRRYQSPSPTPVSPDVALRTTREYRSDDMISPRTIPTSYQLSQAAAMERSPLPLESPWDHPAYSQPSSPSQSLHSPTTAYHTPTSAHPDKWRPRVDPHRNSYNALISSPSTPGGINKRSSFHLGASTAPNGSSSANPLRRSFNGAGPAGQHSNRLSRDFGQPPPSAPIEGYNDSVPTWQQQLRSSGHRSSAFMSLSRSNSSRSGNANGRSSSSRGNSRRSSRNLDSFSFSSAALYGQAPHSALSIQSSSSEEDDNEDEPGTGRKRSPTKQAAALAAALAKLEMLQDSRAGPSSPSFNTVTGRVAGQTDSERRWRFSPPSTADIAPSAQPNHFENPVRGVSKHAYGNDDSFDHKDPVSHARGGVNLVDGPTGETGGGVSRRKRQSTERPREHQSEEPAQESLSSHAPSVYSTPTLNSFPDPDPQLDLGNLSSSSSSRRPRSAQPDPRSDHPPSSTSTMLALGSTVSYSTVPALTLQQPLNASDIRELRLDLPKQVPARPRSGSASLKSPQSLRLGSVGAIARRDSQNRAGAVDRARIGPFRLSGVSRRCPPPSASGAPQVPAFAKAKAVTPDKLLDRLSQDRSQAGSPGMLILDLRPLHLFLAQDPSPRVGRIRGSVNVNFPSLLIKRFRKGNTTSFNLESFITTETGKRFFRDVCPSGDPSDVHLCVIDEKLGEREFASLDSTGTVGAVLVSMLERRRADTGEVEIPGKQKDLWYLAGEMADLVQAGRARYPSLCAAGADDGDQPPNITRQTAGMAAVSILQPSPAGSSGSSPGSDVPTPTMASSSKLIHSHSDNALATQSSFARRKGRNLPQLSLVSSKTLPEAGKLGTGQTATRPGPLAPTLAAVPPTPGLFRSYSENQSVTLRELPESAIPGLQRKKARPAQLQRLDCSDSVRQGASSPSTAEPSLAGGENGTGNGLNGFGQRTAGGLSGKRRGLPATLAPPKSFQEIAMAQASTPTRASFASAANIGQSSQLARGSDDYMMDPPRTTMVASYAHSRNDSSSSTGSSSSTSTAQYPTFQSPEGQSQQQQQSFQPLQPSRGFSQSSNKPHGNGNDNNTVAPFNVSVIIPGFLYLGSEPIRPSDVEELESVGIKRILNMAVECDTQERWKGRFEKIATIPMRDSLAEVNVQDRIKEACMLIGDADLHQKPTYVHCKAGKSRSVTIVLAYLIHRNHWPLKRAYAHVSERRKGVSPNIGFVAELMRFEEAELGSRSQGVIGSGNTPVHEHSGQNPRNGYFHRTHSKSGSSASAASSASASASSAASPGTGAYTPSTARSESSVPTSLDGRPTIVRHLSLIANTAMNLSADQAGSKAAKDAQAQARNARVRESLPPGVGFAGLLQLQDEHEPRPGHTRSRSKTYLEAVAPSTSFY